MSSIPLAEYRKMIKAKPKAKSRRPVRRGAKVESEGEATLAQHLKAHGIAFDQEFKFCETRKWRADFHIVGHKLLVEVEGGIWSGGRHTRGKGYQADIEKYNAATILGYTVLRFSTADVKSGGAIKGILELVEK
ncbi:DUF559 domain-containing protein [Acinetobacter larvae]|uniref:DUF559 domain-containing protein n=1 Tax=Acinetobacter larvae TaxID=1789224 RepID=A0A1B2LZC3_9GAMM|nr:DUF559 domain-containing protein [Acinetobacter larvae]AOA58259.1 hypothetical protein BFG52_07755 [Acinetobacter larvae]